ncbi:hypothetical protein [Krasilnikovia sp. M28-CT-15]|uniref:hypothetical protein n=1 Tax=Krasilnikovia sp. M28-CT-15 TaxID=3373540 RepID=UPI00399D113E
MSSASEALGPVLRYDLDHSIAAVTAALGDGRVPDPGDTQWRNTAHLLKRRLTVTSWTSTNTGRWTRRACRRRFTAHTTPIMRLTSTADRAT